MATARDPEGVSGPAQLILGRLAAARAAGDLHAAREAWRDLLTITFDRIRIMVITESRHQLSAQEQEDALGTACERLTKLMLRERGFRGSTIGEYVNLLKLVVRGACVDTQRRETKHSQHRAALHAGRDGEEGDRYTREAYEAIVRADAERAQALEAAEELRELGEQFLDWALPRLTPAQRAMAECDRDGLTVEQAMRRLGKQRNAVYKLRERAMEALRMLYEEWER